MSGLTTASFLSGGGLSSMAQDASNLAMDAHGAKMTAKQTAANIQKQEQDVDNAIQSGKEDTTNKKISSAAQNAKGISY
ncbi:hypothetical protein [Pseudomonas sp. LRF_L74]|uniref:hypothetical protein n=1 Tax=Pseudomonas sp. LRF_L74 TaxID=3369422 RepID=UPI003F5DA95D